MCFLLLRGLHPKARGNDLSRRITPSGGETYPLLAHRRLPRPHQQSWLRQKAAAAIRAEAECLAEDEGDRAEAIQVLRDMETLRAWRGRQFVTFGGQDRTSRSEIVRRRLHKGTFDAVGCLSVQPDIHFTPTCSGFPEVRNRRTQALRIIAESAKSRVAGRAQEPANVPSAVVMIHGQRNLEQRLSIPSRGEGMPEKGREDEDTTKYLAVSRSLGGRSEARRCAWICRSSSRNNW